MTRLAADKITVRYRQRVAVDAVSLTLESGMLVALLGPNGAGKSTLLSCLAGLRAPDAGTVTLDGQPLAAIGLPALARKRAFLPQNPRAEWPVSVERLVALGLTPQLPVFRGLPESMAARVTAALTQVDLLDRRNQPATTLSGGELARAMLARALVGDPALLLADEPLAGLDPRHALDGMRRLRALADAGKLVIVALHDLTLAARYASHVAMLRAGRPIVFGPTATTLDAALLREAFEAEAQVNDCGTHTASVNFIAPSDF